MKRVTITAVALLLVLVSWGAGSTQASQGKQYYEITAATDTPDDFSSPAHNGALDIVAVHVLEKHRLDGDSGSDVVQFRLELRNRDDISTYLGNVPIEYVIGFKVNGEARTYNLTMTQDCAIPPPPQGETCDDPKVPSPHFTTQAGGVIFSLDAESEGLVPGATVSEVYAASATDVAGNKAYQDVAPGDNANQPAGPELAPAETGGPLTLVGVYPFLGLESTDDLNLYLVPGGEDFLDVTFVITDDFTGLDRIVTGFDAATGWSIEGNLGNDFSVTAGGQRIDYSITVKAPPLAQEGDATAIIMDAVLVGLGGHVVLPFTASVTAAKADLPGYNITLATPGPFKEGDVSTVHAAVSKDGQALSRHEVKADFVQGSQSKTITGKETEEAGVYEFAYVFTNAGDWTVDVYVSEFKPSPHRQFQVQVNGEGGGLLPGFEVAALVVAAMLAMGLARRRR